jgi:hypothetical protein
VNPGFPIRLRFLVAWFSLASAAAGLAAGAPNPCGGFVGPERYGSSESAVLAVADFNLDGLADVAAGARTTIAILLGQPENGLQAPIVTATDIPLDALLAADFDGDGKPDLLWVGSSVMYFEKGNGDGTFQPPVSAGFSPSELAAGDVDGDGILDVVAVAYPFGPILVSLGLGDGTFAPAIDSPIDDLVSSFDLGDVDGDGDLDLVAGAFYADTLGVYPGLGNGTFGAPTILATDASRTGIQLADFDGDGHLDIADVTLEVAELRLGRGDGTFADPLASPAGPFPLRLEPADLDGDGVLDLAVVQSNGNSPSSGGLLLLQGRGDGTFVPGEAYTTGSGGGPLAAADFDGDGNVDVAYAAAGVPEVWLLRGRGDGTLRGVPYALFGPPAYLVTAGDFDEDGKPDLAATGFQSFALVTIATAGPGHTFTNRGGYPASGYLVSAVTGDFHGTGHLDLVFTRNDQATPSLAILPGHGDGTFSPYELSALPLPPTQSYPMVAGRFDADAHLDLAIAVSNNGSAGGTVTTFLGRGDGTFTTGPVIDLPTYPTALTESDFDGDGNLDLAVATAFDPSGRLYVLFGNGDGSFSASTSYPIHPYATSVFTGDVNEDGEADILVAQASSTVAILLGLGGGSFAPAYSVGVGWPPSAGAAADFNGDGHLDLLTAGGFQSKASLLLGFGDGTFASPRTWIVGVYPGPIAVGDFDGNGFADAALADQYPFSGGVAILWSSRIAGVVVAPATALVGQSATLHAAGAEFAATSYQWRKDGVPLTDGGSISGSRTATLTIDPVTFADAGSFDVLVDDSCGSVASNPALLSVEFADVPVSSLFHDDILAIATAGITGGCGGANYCPTSPVRRDQMAVFLLKAEHGSAYTPPACTGMFADVPCPSAFADWIEQLAAEGITGGCGGGIYCPDASVTRAQMAVFLLKTLLGSAYAPPAATGIFGDVPVGSFAADFIEDLYNRGITGGCSASPLLYCPGSTVLRQQMATFLVRTFFP